MENLEGLAKMENLEGLKLCDAQSSNGEDRISSLPDVILHHILSHFPTDQVVRLSLLSTRWKYLWTSIPNLNFSNKPHSRVYPKLEILPKFQNFVERVLSHHGLSNIHKFHLEYRGLYGGSHLETWMSILSRHKLGELVLRAGGDEFTFPNLLDISKSITVLELNIPRVRVLLLPASICFHNLKVARFVKVRFFGEKSTREVSFSFPVLEEFTMIHCYWLKIKTVHIYAPALKKLELDGSRYKAGLYENEVKMDVMNLISLSIFGGMRHDYCFSYLPSLSEALVDVRYDFDNKRLVRCFTRLNHVKNLTFSDRCIKNLFSADILNNLQVFSSLISLTVTHRSYNAFSPKRLINFLCYMPNIEALVIELDPNDPFDDADRIWTHETIPQCSLSKLKLVEFMYFNGGENEQCLIAYLLVRTLEKMVISFTSRWHDPERRSTILTDIQTLPRGSVGTQVIVNFSDDYGKSELHLKPNSPACSDRGR